MSDTETKTSHDCSGCTVPGEFKTLCFDLHKIVDEMEDFMDVEGEKPHAPEEPLPEKVKDYAKIIEMLMLLAIRGAHTLFGTEGVHHVFTRTAKRVMPKEEMIGAVVGALAKHLGAAGLMSGIVPDTKELKEKLLLATLPPDAPKH